MGFRKQGIESCHLNRRFAATLTSKNCQPTGTTATLQYVYEPESRVQLQQRITKSYKVGRNIGGGVIPDE
jgi:hypothetical protein